MTPAGQIWNNLSTSVNKDKNKSYPINEIGVYESILKKISKEMGKEKALLYSKMPTNKSRRYCGHKKSPFSNYHTCGGEIWLVPLLTKCISPEMVSSKLYTTYMVAMEVSC